MINSDTRHQTPARTALPPLPASWSQLTWEQLCAVWEVKQRYGGHPDAVRCAVLLELCGLEPAERPDDRYNDKTISRYDNKTGETVYLLRRDDDTLWTVTPRQLAHIAREALPWVGYPYGDPGKEAVKDEKGEVVEEAVSPVRGYVSPMRDAMILPKDEIVMETPIVIPIYRHHGISTGLRRRRHFALPRMACNNLTWQQYRALQAAASQLFAEDADEEQALDAQALFMANVLTPRSIALLDTTGGNIRLRPHYTYQYDAERAEGLEKWWRKHLTSANTHHPSPITLFHICFQVYQTAIAYYAASYPLLFNGSEKNDPLRDALTGEVGTINTIMKYAGYAEQQQVYDSNLPFVLDILNTMTKEAREIERMNARIKKK